MNDEEEAFHHMEMQQAEQALDKLSEAAADQFVMSKRDTLDIMTLHDAYKKGYKDALMDLMIRGKQHQIP